MEAISSFELMLGKRGSNVLKKEVDVCNCSFVFFPLDAMLDGPLSMNFLDFALPLDQVILNILRGLIKLLNWR